MFSCDLPDSYAPFVVLVHSLLDDPNHAADHATIQEVIQCLLNEEAQQSEATHIDIPHSALLIRDHRKPGLCYNCGEHGHLKIDCELSPKEICMWCECKQRAQMDDEEANLVNGDHVELEPAIY